MSRIRRSRAGIALVLVPVLAGLTVGCGARPGPSGSTATPAPAGPTPSATPAGPTASASAGGPPPTSSPSGRPGGSGLDDCVAATLASLSEPQRIGQLFFVGLKDDLLDEAERAAIARYHYGSVAFTTRTAAGVAAVRATTDAVQAEATLEATGGVGFLVAANQEGGQIQGLSGPGFDVIPSALVQGTMTPAALRRAAAGWGRQLLSAGVNLDFAPVADVVPPGSDSQNAPIGALERAFGHDPSTVVDHVAAFVAGMTRAGVATTAKHFPGLGRVVGNTDFTASVSDSLTTRDDPYLDPFRAAIDGRVPFVMVSLATYERIDPDHLAVFSPTIVNRMLRDDLGFRGVIVSDALGATAVASIPAATRAIDFLDAGGEMIISNQLKPAARMASAIAARVAADPSFRARVDAAVGDVLGAKASLGLLPCDE